jgi:hypothetical protein
MMGGGGRIEYIIPVQPLPDWLRPRPQAPNKGIQQLKIDHRPSILQFYGVQPV